jgi:hypothetical protein
LFREVKKIPFVDDTRFRLSDINVNSPVKTL